MECQTDAFLDRPTTPLFIPAKTGKDVATQILEGELFDFDLEVKPMLEVLVGKTIEQALLEVMEEEELANLRASQYAYEELRNAELAEIQRLEEQERRHREEKERRKQQQWDVIHKHNETSQKEDKQQSVQLEAGLGGAEAARGSLAGPESQDQSTSQSQRPDRDSLPRTLPEGRYTEITSSQERELVEEEEEAVSGEVRKSLGREELSQ
uniref:Radial spoke head 3 n=1 Tax=Rousettus aegyptiacus TaxID=9407 RepID=A0A7J8KG10_ROUAE|nr:radial spoke head 3 [Rousettus aegyptiacus]